MTISLCITEAWASILLIWFIQKVTSCVNEPCKPVTVKIMKGKGSVSNTGVTVILPNFAGVC